MQPRNEADRLELARRAYEKSLYATAARLWADALAANPALSRDRRAQHRYNEARRGTAGCGHGKDDPRPDELTRSKLRDQALRGLKAELAEWTTLLKSGNPNAKAVVAETLVNWQNDVDLVGIRDEKELARLPEVERSSFKQLWSAVDDLLRDARAVRQESFRTPVPVEVNVDSLIDSPDARLETAGSMTTEGCREIRHPFLVHAVVACC